MAIQRTFPIIPFIVLFVCIRCDRVISSENVKIYSPGKTTYYFGDDVLVSCIQNGGFVSSVENGTLEWEFAFKNGSSAPVLANGT